jgi:gliding motility-associated-like protein
MYPVKNNVCAGEDLEFELNPFSVGSNPAYEWLVNGNLTGITTNKLKNTDVSLNDGDVVTVQVTVAENCVTGSKIATSGPQNVQVTSLVTPTVSINVASPEVCNNGSVVVSVASQSNEGTSPSYVWKVDGVTQPLKTSSTESLILSGVETKNITVDLTSNANCVSQLTITSAVQTVTVNPIVTPSVFIDPLVPSVCQGANIYALSAVNPDPLATYEWYINGVLDPESSSSIQLSDPSGGDYIQVVSGTSSKCVNPLQVTASDAYTLVVVPLTNPTLLVNDDRPCEGESITIDAYIHLGVSNPSIIWKKDGELLSKTDSKPFNLSNITPSDAGTYTITTRDEEGICVENEASIKITVLEKPIIQIEGDNGKTILEDETATFEGQVINQTALQWESLGGDALSIDPVYTVSPQVSTTYNLVAWNEEETCNSSVPVSVIVVEKVKMSNVFTPNGDGVHDYWTIESIDDYPEARVQIFTRWGQKIYENYSNYADRPWDGKYNGKDSPIGVYYYIVELNSEIPALNEPMKGEVHIIK